jgi:hypothetical protein
MTTSTERTSPRRAGAIALALLLTGCSAAPAAPTGTSMPAPTESLSAPAAAAASSPVATLAPGLIAMGIPRAAARAALLQDGRVVVIGGYKGEVAVPNGEIFDPRKGTFEVFASPVMTQYFHTATLLKDGRVGVIGGVGPGATMIDVIRTWDPATLAFTDVGPMPEPRGLHTATLLEDGRVLVVGGVSSSEGRVYSSAFLWDPATGTTEAVGKLAHARAWHTATLLHDGRVLIAGGPAAAEIWDPATKQFSSAGTMAAPRWWASAALLHDGRVLVTGGFVGETFSQGAVPKVTTADIWDPESGTFSSTGSLREARTMHTSTVLEDGRVVVIGGWGGNAPDPNESLASVEIWDPSKEAFTTGPSLLVGRALHATVLMPDGRLLVIGGSDATDKTIGNAEYLDVGS